MKDVFVLVSLMVCVAGFEGCKKDSEQNIEVAAAILGSWELRHTSSAWFPTGTDHPPGNGNILKFTDTTYESYVNGQLVKSGKYVIVRDLTVEQNVCMTFPAGQFTHRIIYDNDLATTKQFVEAFDNKLSFVSGCYAVDAGHSSLYERQ